MQRDARCGIFICCLSETNPTTNSGQAETGATCLNALSQFRMPLLLRRTRTGRRSSPPHAQTTLSAADMVGLCSVGHATAPGTRYGDLNQDYAVSRSWEMLGPCVRAGVSPGAPVCVCHPQRSTRFGACCFCFATQVVQHAFNPDELGSQSKWQQCCVAAVLDGELAVMSDQTASLS